MKRIVAALRAAGLEVWFDQNELVGGDAWDAKIRGQIKACTLFLPVISASTQARREGYFRIEWKLAAQRTHAIADGTPFLLPVVIDATGDSEALVPEEFRAVQWTRLPAGEVPPAFVQRVQFLLSGGDAAGVARPMRPSDAGRERRAASQFDRRPWLLPAVLGLAACAALAVWSPWKTAPAPAAPSSAAPAAPAPAPVPLSEARQLIAKAWVLLNKPEMARAELDAADALCKRAAALDSTDAEVWATWTHVHSWMVFHRLDDSDARRELARECASRALQLDPESFESRLAQAIYSVRGRGGRQGTEALLRALLKERSDEPRALFTLGFMLAYRPEPAHSEGIAALKRLAENPQFAAVAWDEIGWRFRVSDPRMAEEAADRSIAAKPYWNNLGLKTNLALRWTGDLGSALSTINQIPVTARMEDWAIGIIDEVYAWRREPQERLKFLNTVPREWLSSNWFSGPKIFLVAQARYQAGALETARRDYRRALDLIEKRLAEVPNSLNLLALKAEAHLRLDERTEAEKTYALALQIKKPASLELAVLFESGDTLIERLQSMRPKAAILRLDPTLDPVRSHPRFADLLAKAEADPSKSPTAPVTP